MKVFFIGTLLSSYVALEALLQSKSTVVGVLTRDKSGYNSDFKELNPLCEQHDVHCKMSQGKLTADDIAFIKAACPDVLFCVGWSHLLPLEVLTIPKLGCIGFHPAPLPMGRGRHPIIWTLLLGLTHTQSCFFMLESQPDSGNLINVKDIAITPNETAETLMQKILDEIPSQMTKIITDLQNGDLKKLPQCELHATSWRKRQKSDGEIHFRMSVTAIERHIRALTKPYPGAHITFKDKDFIVWNYESFEKIIHFYEPGKVLSVENNTITVACFDGIISFKNEELASLIRPGEYFI